MRLLRNSVVLCIPKTPRGRLEACARPARVASYLTLCPFDPIVLDKAMVNQDPELPDEPDELPHYLADILRDYQEDPETLAAVRRYVDALEAYDPRTDPSDIDPSDIGPEGEVVDTRTKGGWTDVLKKVKCGKSGCVCSSGGPLHGPYHYRYKKNGDELEWEYVKKSESSLLA